MVPGKLLFALALFASLGCQLGLAIRCYERGFETKFRVHHSEADDGYCTFAPENWRNLSAGQLTTLSSLDKQSETMAKFELFFSETNRFFRPLTVCVFEKYYIGEQAEAVFRCACNQDDCNQAKNLQTYLKHLDDTSEHASVGKPKA